MIGQHLAHYEITALVGKGGMGEVYRARDTKLDREVALKILPREMSGDAERIARFHREARTLASLQHPHVASIYGFEDLPEARFLVMELVEGEDLAERLNRGALSMDDAIEIARQIALGLEAAHEQGIVHRDLKPANVKITPEGAVKILDFGLARAYIGDQGSESDLANSPTITAAMTQAGTILGTAAYMSPEQARGKYVDRRSDVWALGVILFEMLTGRRMFEGETVSDTLAAVLRAETDWSVLPEDTPASVKRALRRCLERDPRRRMRSAGDVWLELEDTTREVAAAAPASARSPLLPVALLALAAAVALGAWLLRPADTATPDRRPRHLSLALPDGMQFVSRDRLPLGAPQPCLDISADGRLVVCVVENAEGIWLYRRFLDQPEGEIIPGTEGACHPRISPDGRQITFLSGNFLKRVDADGDRVTPMIELANSFGQCWSGNEEILVTRREAVELLRIDVRRNEATPVASANRRSRYYWPEPVPGTDGVLVNESHVAKSDESEADPIVLHRLDGGPTVRVGVDGSVPRLIGPDRLLFVRDGALMAAPFDIGDPARQARPHTIVEGLVVESSIGQYSVSQEGTLVYVPGDWLIGKSLVWDDGAGNIEELPFPSMGYGDFELSPDGTKLAITIGSANAAIWVYDLERGTRRVLTQETRSWSPTWSPDGSRIAYGSQDDDGSYSMRVRTVGSSDAPEILRTGEYSNAPYSWSEDAGLLFSVWDQTNDIFRLDPSRPEEVETLVATPASEWSPDVSPDGRWIAYTSDESGRYEIYVRSLGPDGRSWPVSIDGGEEPIWSSDGSAIFFRNGGQFMRTPVLEASADGRRFRAGTPQVHVEGAYANVPGVSHDVGPDDRRLLLLRTDGGTERASRLNVILNFDTLLEERLGDD